MSVISTGKGPQSSIEGISEESLALLLDRVEKPARYIGGELHRVVKDPQTVSARLCLAFPDAYEIGMSHLGLRILYSHLNADPALMAERAYCPFPDMEKALREEGIPLFSLENRIPLSSFNAVGFSLQSEMTNSNVLTMLDLSNIPIHRRDRTEADPLIIAGGPVIFNPEPMSDFIDAFLVGDGEEALAAFLHRDAAMRQEGVPRKERLRRLANDVVGVYAPALYDTRVDEATGFVHVVPTEGSPYPVKKALLDDVNKFPFPEDILVPQTDIVHDRVSVEIARGCTEGCRFCQAGIIYRPVRERTPESIVDTIVNSIDKTGFDEASLTALSTADYSCVTPLAKAVMAELQTRRTAMSVSSLRVYGVTEDLAREIAKVRKTGFTIAPEAGTQRMRDVINKGITDENINTASEIAFSNGWTRLKMYFMIGLPTETDEDVIGIAETALRVLKIGRECGPPGLKVVVSVSCLVPKAHSTFQWVPFDSPKELLRKQAMLRERLQPFRSIQLKCHEVRQSRLEAVFSRGDRRLGKVIETAWNKGARFDEWTDWFREDIWLESLSECGIDPEDFFGPVPTEADLVWDHIDSRVEKQFLLKDLKWGLKSRFMHACEKPYLPKIHDPPRTKDGVVKLVCYDCGVDCDLKAIAIEREEAGVSADDIVKEKLAKLAAMDPKDVSIPVLREPGEFQEGSSISKRTSSSRPAPQPFEPTPGPYFRYRVAYEKSGLSRYLSHLETSKLIERSGARAKWPIAFSGGFHPHPKLAFGPALPVGIAGNEELFDVVLTKPWDPENLRLILNETVHDGFRILAVRPIEVSTTALDAVVSLFEYSISLDKDFVKKTCESVEGLRQKIAEYLAREDGWAIESVRRSKKKHRVRILKAAEMVQTALVAETEEKVLLTLRLSKVDGRVVRPTDLATSLLGKLPAGTRITRIGMGAMQEDLFVPALDLALPPSPIEAKAEVSVP